MYHESPIAEFRGNILIEALPPPRRDEDIVKLLYRLPDFSAEERRHEPHIRKLLVDRMENVRIPRPEYFDLFHILEELVFRGYESKNPSSPTTSYWLHYLEEDHVGIVPTTGAFKPSARASTILGPSGVGKSKMIEQVLAMFPMRIQHPTRSATAIPIDQIVYLNVECPSSASISSLCKAILGAIDDVVGTSYRKEHKHSRISELQDAVDRAVRAHFIGLIVVDELQNISVQKAGGKQAFLQFLLRLLNIAGVPFILSGTEELEDILSEKQWVARRAEAGGVIPLQPMNWTLWSIFIKTIWRYQWTAFETRLTVDLSKQLFQLSGGLPGYAVSVYSQAQKDVIGDSDETISTSTLREAHRKATNLSATHIPEVSKTASRHDQTNDLETAQKTAVNIQKTRTQAHEPANMPDVNRIQHPEFEMTIGAAMAANVVATSGSDSTLIRDSRATGRTLECLCETGVVVEDLLNLGAIISDSVGTD